MTTRTGGRTATVDPAALVADLGFLVRWDLPADDHDALLVIALRDRPTLRHYDPELIAFWQMGDDGRGHQVDLSLASTMPMERPFTWGEIRIIDRLHVTNTWVSFGGAVSAELVSPGTAVVTFRSAAPILRRGGHSQRYDALAGAVASFFGRLFVPIDFQPGAERHINSIPPEVRYAAFLQHDLPRIASSELVREAYGPDARLVRAEAERLRRRDPDAWQAGGELLARLGMAVDAGRLRELGQRVIRATE
jgi:hypothetical protein